MIVAFELHVPGIADAVVFAARDFSSVSLAQPLESIVGVLFFGKSLAVRRTLTRQGFQRVYQWPMRCMTGF